MLTTHAHDADVNVISWNRSELVTITCVAGVISRASSLFQGRSSIMATSFRNILPYVLTFEMSSVSLKRIYRKGYK